MDSRGLKNYVYHGSENSLDKDIYIIIDEPLSLQDSKQYCELHSHNSYNPNLITVKDGQVTWCYKGTIDECNNSILATYHLHKQYYPNPITERMERDINTKIDRTLRGLLSIVSRTEHRIKVKEALKSDSREFKLKILESIVLKNIEDFNKKDTIENIYKFIAFQIGQTLALVEEGFELFTKNQVGIYYPNLQDFLSRKSNTDPSILDYYLTRLLFEIRHA